MDWLVDWLIESSSSLYLQVSIPVVSVRLVKKHKTAGLVPNGLAITMDTGQKVTPAPCQTFQNKMLCLWSMRKWHHQCETLQEVNRKLCHLSVSPVCLCVPAVQRQRLRRPEEDLHSPAGSCFTDWQEGEWSRCVPVCWLFPVCRWTGRVWVWSSTWRSPALCPWWVTSDCQSIKQLRAKQITWSVTSSVTGSRRF